MTVHLELEPQLADQIKQLSEPYTSPEEFILEILRRETAKTTPTWIWVAQAVRIWVRKQKSCCSKNP
jgi:hypothetical protein